MASFLNRIFSVFKAKNNNPNNLSISVNVWGAPVTVNSVDIKAANEELANYRDQKGRRYRRYARLIRHKNIWIVLSYAKCIQAIHMSDNFYDLDKALLNYQNALARIDTPDFCPSENEILCAFRFCDMQNYAGKCEHRLSDKEKQSISNWNNFTLDYTNILEEVSKRFITYWDEALGSYRNKSAYLSRIDDIINHLNELKYKKGLSIIPYIEDSINKIQIHYIGLKSTSPDDRHSTSKKTVEP